MAEAARGRSAKLTKRTVDAAAAEDVEYILWDSEIPGFGLRVSPSGAKSYLFKYRVGGGRAGTKRKPTIGRQGPMTPEQARAIAKDWAAEVRRGGDPSLRRQEARRAADMNELFDRYLTEHADLHKKASSIANDRRLIEKRLRKALGRKKIEQVARSDVAAIHRSLAATPYEANRTLALLSKCFSLAERWGLRPDGSNPCRHVARYKEGKRERFLSQKELARLGQALAAADRGELTDADGEPVAVSSYAVAVIRLLIFTGARKSEVLQLRWTHVNLEAGRLELQDSKTGAKFVYLPAPARKVLADLPRVSDNPHVIVGGKPGAHLVNIKDPWGWIRAAAGLPEVRLHDLRHSFASVGAGGGMSLPIIGALLGHRETATTARYAHLSDDPLRVASDEIGRRIEEAMATVQNAV